MKKEIISAAAVVSLISTFAAPIYADDDITVTLDGKEIVFDVAPIIENDRTLVPVRAIFEALGAQVEWDEDTRTVVSAKDNRGCILQIDNTSMFVSTFVDGTAVTETIELDVPAKIVDDRTLIPLRAVSEAYDCTVEWDGAERAITITSAAE